MDVAVSKIVMFLDDVRTPPLPSWTLFKTVEEAQELLRAGRVKWASLDHDLGACDECTEKGAHIGDMQTPETTFYNHCSHAKSGYDLCVWMAETGHWPDYKPVVHSANPVGSERMRGVIERYCSRPVLWDVERT